MIYILYIYIYIIYIIYILYIYIYTYIYIYIRTRFAEIYWQNNSNNNNNKVNESRYKQCGLTTHFSTAKFFFEKILKKYKYWQKLLRKY